MHAYHHIHCKWTFNIQKSLFPGGPGKLCYSGPYLTGLMLLLKNNSVLISQRCPLLRGSIICNYSTCWQEFVSTVECLFLRVQMSKSGTTVVVPTVQGPLYMQELSSKNIVMNSYISSKTMSSLWCACHLGLLGSYGLCILSLQWRALYNLWVFIQVICDLQLPVWCFTNTISRTFTTIYMCRAPKFPECWCSILSVTSASLFWLQNS